MNKRFCIILYLVVLGADLFAVYTGNETLRYTTKPLLMPLLIAFFIYQTKDFPSSLKKWVTLALIFSWAGDVSLMFDDVDDIFFIAGLAAFLWAHIWYATFFYRVIKTLEIRQRSLLFIIGLIYYLVLMDIIDSSSLGFLKWPVRIYGAVLMTMFTGSLHMIFAKRNSFAVLTITGALFFVISDSLLALNKFHKEFDYASIAIMLTYGIAQLLITLGAVGYITSTSKQ